VEESKDRSSPTPVWRRWIGEPLLWFVLLGALVWIAYVSLVPPSRGTILVESEAVRALEREREELLGRPLTDTERARLVEAFVDDEVLLREAYRRGFDHSDARVRERLLEVMRASIDETVPEPSRPQLEAYFLENIERYQRGDEVTVDHVFFSFGSDRMPKDPASLLAALNAGDEFMEFGEPSWTGPTIRGATLAELRQMLGSGFAERVFTVEPEVWAGPVESSSGVHFIRVSGRRPTAEPSFDAIETHVRQDWELRRQREIQQRKISEMKKNYRIVVENE